jgi:hypothetical protein
VLIVFSLRRESLKLILATNPSTRWFCHRPVGRTPSGCIRGLAVPGINLLNNMV